MKTLFLSYFINSNTPVYGGKKNALEIVRESSINNGDSSNSSKYSFNSHIGTHIDFPLHFSNSGLACSDYCSSFWIFNDVGFVNSNVENFEQNIDNLSSEIEILLLKTSFGENRGSDIYLYNQPVIPSTWATMLKKKFPKLRVFGFDLISLTSKLDRDEGKKAHKSFLLENDILILEDMNLSELDLCPNKIIISPLLIEKSDGVPCTVIAIM